MVTGYNLVRLKDMIDELGEDRVSTILLRFSCPINKDVEYFIHRKAAEFAKQGLAVTYLLFTSYKKEMALIGYFALAHKTMFVHKKALSKSKLKRIGKFGTLNKDLKCYLISTPLIGQLAKNFTDGLNKMISGDELLKMACDKVSEAHSIIGGKVVYLECEDKDKVIEFYNRNGFVKFGERKLDKDELGKISGEHLVQMFKYLD